MTTITFQRILAEMGMAYLGQQVADIARPLAQAAAGRFPDLVPDILVKRLAVELVSTLPGALRAAFPDHDKLLYFAEIAIRQAIGELKSAAKERSQASVKAESADEQVATRQRTNQYQSVLSLFARARAGEIGGISAEDLKRIIGFMGQLAGDDLARLKRIQDGDELVGLAFAGTIEEFRHLLLTVRPPDAAMVLADGAKKIGAEVTGSYTRLRTWSKETAAKIDKKTAELVAERERMRPIKETEAQKALALRAERRKRNIFYRLWRLGIHGEW